MSPPIAFFDLEVRSRVDVTKEGLHRHARDPSTVPIVASFRFIGGKHDGAGGVYAPKEYRAGLTEGLVLETAAMWNEHVKGGGYVCAWNAQYDRTVLKYANARGWLDLLEPAIDQTLCAQSMAENYSLPGKLAAAGAALNVPIQKDRRGAQLIRLLCNANNPWEPRAKDLEDFWSYAMTDTDSMVEVWRRTRKWLASEWADYHVLERINEQGMPIDREFAEAAVAYSEDELAALNQELRELTGDPAINLRASKRKVTWLHAQLEGTDLADSMWVTSKRKKQTVRALSAKKSVQRSLEERLDNDTDRQLDVPAETRDRVRQFLDILARGNGVASVKYAAMLRSDVDSVLYHQYRCSSTITGRHASRGVQWDNVLRDKLPKAPLEARGIHDHPALHAIDCINGLEDARVSAWLLAAHEEVIPAEDIRPGDRADYLEALFSMPISLILSRCLRATVVADDDKTMVWGDWSAIEARVLPWLARSEDYLELFRADVCVYCREAVRIFDLDCSWSELYARAKSGNDPEAEYQRLVGKVAVLALGYQGGAGSLLSMARGYGLKLTEAFAEQVKVAFRESNPWLVRFWRKLEEAAFTAMRQPGRPAFVGRLQYRKVGADLLCLLPCGRPILYPQARIEDVYKERFQSTMETITYRKVWQGTTVRGELYGGILAENATQGAAASLLRAKLRELVNGGFPVIGPKHDEILMHTPFAEYAAILRERMETPPAWAEGLPLKAEVEFGAFYGK